MKRIILSKADPITNKEPVDQAIIDIRQKLPKFEDLKHTEMYYRDEAADLWEILKNHTPQGMRHQLLILMLKDKEDLYRGK
ncbi:MAG: hypothetical protein ACFE95_12355 [Candidatus Hodarchaeota archaeon]